MQVRYGEGLAIHTGPGSCAVTREGLGEALTGARTGGVLSGVTYVVRGVPMSSWHAEGNKVRSAIARASTTPRRH